MQNLLKSNTSTSLFEAAKRVIPGGVNSPVRSFKALGIPPVIVKEGRGDTIVDVEGNRYIDFCGSWGALIHGHVHPVVANAAAAQVWKGSSFGITTEIEGKIAAKICHLLPSVEKIRFVSSGTEATMSAIRLARGFTGREAFIKFSGCYHGHADMLLVSAGSGVTKINQESTSKGVPHAVIKHTLVLPYNDVDRAKKTLRTLGKEIAAVIVEPIPANMGVVLPKEGFLEMLREETLKCGTLLIFDEVISGFRVGPQGAQGMYGITPDLTCLGKIIGGGFPAAAFGGRAEIMDHLAPLGEVYQAGTLSGSPVAMEAGYSALTLLEESGFYERLEMKTRLLTEPVEALIRKKNLNVSLQRIGSMFTLFFGAKKVENFEECKKLNLDLFRDFYIAMLAKGIYFSPAQYEGNFVSMAHTEENLKYACECVCDYLERVS